MHPSIGRLCFGLVFSGLFCGSLAAGEMAFTFDDAPRASTRMLSGEERTPMLIKALEQAGIPGAIFYANPVDLQNADGIHRLEQYAAAGHRIGNHTYSHPNANRVSPEDYIEEIRKADAILHPMKGFISSFRYSYSAEGSTPEAQKKIRDAVQAMGYEQGYFTADAADWYLDQKLADAAAEGRTIHLDRLREVYVQICLEAIQDYDDLAVKVLGRSPMHIWVMHEDDVNALFLADVAAALKAKGWKMISAEEAFKDPLAQRVPKHPPTQFRLPGLAQEMGIPFDGERLSREREIDRLLEEKGVFSPLPEPGPTRALLVAKAVIAGRHAHQAVLATQQHLPSAVNSGCFRIHRQDVPALEAIAKRATDFQKTDPMALRAWIEGKPSAFNPEENLFPILRATLDPPRTTPVTKALRWMMDKTSRTEAQVAPLASLLQTALETDDDVRLSNLSHFYGALGFPVSMEQLGLVSDPALGKVLAGSDCTAPYATDEQAWQRAVQRVSLASKAAK